MEILSTITIAAYVTPPYVNDCFTKFPTKCDNPGTDLLFLHNQLRSFGFRRIRLIEAKNEERMITALRQGLADIGGTTVFSQNMAINDSHLWLSMPAFEDNPIVFHRKGATYSPNLLFNFCPYYVWFFIFACLIAVGLFELLYSVFKKSTAKTLSKKYTSYASQSPLLCWWLAFGIFLSIYSQYLGLTLNIRAHEGAPFASTDTLLRLLYSGQCKLFVQQSLMRNVEELGEYLPLGSVTKEDLLKIDVNLEKNFDAVLERMLQAKGCNIGMNLKSELLSRWQCDDFEMHEFHEMPKYHMAYMYRKNLTKQYPIMNNLNMGSAHSRYFLLQEKISDKQNGVFLKSADHATDISLNWEQLKDAFWLLFGGLLFASVTFALTRLSFRIQCKIRSMFQVSFSRRISFTVDMFKLDNSMQ